MSQLQTYSVQFYNYLNKLGKGVDELPESLQDLINKFEFAKSLWEKADNSTKSNLFDVLLQSDAFISTLIEQEEMSPESEDKIDKIKLMAFKARALKVKWKLNNPND
ncbi:MAG: hypothetical protein IPG89_07275 [Bacteroidetes bacterium]|nr:hypothetical protein [Bacteroidota bacterium]